MSTYSHADLGLVRTFEAVAAHGSFSLAANRLGLSQSTVSDHVRFLEEKIGRQLIARTTRRVKLTAAGETMLVYARAVLQVSERIGEHFSQQAQRRPLRLGLVQDLAGARLATILRLFRIDHPDCPVVVRASHTPELLEMVDAGELDVVLGKQRVGAGLGRTLWTSGSTWIGNGALVGADEPVPLLVSMAGTSTSRTIALEALGRANLPWVMVMEANSLACLRAALEADLGVSVCGSDHRPDFAAPIHDHPVLPPLADQQYFIVNRKGGGDDHVRAFAAFIETVVLRMRDAELQNAGMRGTAGG